MKLSAIHKRNTFSEFAFFKASLVGNMKGFLQNTVAFDSINPIDSGITGILLIGIANVGNQIKIIFGFHNATGLITAEEVSPFAF